HRRPRSRFSRRGRCECARAESRARSAPMKYGRMSALVFVFLPIPEDWGAQAGSLQRRADCSSHSKVANFSEGASTKNARQAAEHGKLAACAPQTSAFWTWFIDNPRQQSSK